jgi:hypothetical protein
MRFQNPVHGSHGTQITAAIQKGGINLLRRLVDEPFIVEVLGSGLEI